MNLSRYILLGGVLVFAAITWVRSDIMWASVLSLLSFAMAAFGERHILDAFWRVELLEYWIAIVVWTLGGAVALRSLMRPQVPTQPSRLAEKALLLLAFVIMTAPFVSPVHPHVQGELLTTRLLPPLSAGVRTFIHDESTMSSDESWIARTVRTTSTFLLHRPERFAGATAALPQNEASPQPVIFLFGTDDNGRDVFSRVVYGARVSTAIGLAAALGAVCIGTLVGFLAGYTTRFLDSLLMRFTDLMLAIPSLFLVVGMTAFLQPSVVTLILVLSLTGWMGIARTVRTEVIRLREREFVLAAKLLNQRATTILLRHILPNVKPLLVTAATIQFSNAVLAEASLSFLGLGVQPPTPSLGNMLGQALSYMRTGWWLAVFPGLVLAATLLALHSVAERRAGVTA